MKSITLLKVPLKTPQGEELTLDYREYLTTIMQMPIAGQGLDYAEVRRRLRVLDALDNLKEDAASLDLEDADFEFMAEKVKQTPFRFASRAFIDFVDNVTK